MADPNRVQPEQIDRVLYLLFAGMLFFTAVLIGVEYFFKDDAQVFQVIAGILTGFTGAFFGRLKPNPQGNQTPPQAQPAITAQVEPQTQA